MTWQSLWLAGDRASVGLERSYSFQAQQLVVNCVRQQVVTIEVVDVK